ncbi:MAG: hypothetical protein RLZZ227_2461 [Pseudomonadota bacterium]|jgi:outer membrane receptor protein involved in Fe transport
MSDSESAARLHISFPDQWVIPFKNLTLALGLLHCPILAAQDASIEEVVVTAQKRRQLLQDVPVPVSVLTAALLRQAGVQTLNDVARQIPMLEVQSSTSSITTSLRLRRVGNIGTIPNFEPAVGLFVDGAFRTRPVFASGEFFDLERVEVLRGPQSTLHGKNTTGGVVAIHTQAPPEVLSLRAELTAGLIDGANDASHRQFRGHIAGPLAETLRGGLGIATTESGPIFDEALIKGGAPSNDTGRRSLRGTLQWGSPDTIQWRLIANLAREDNNREVPDIYYDPAGIGRSVLPILRAAGVSDTCTDNDPHNRITCIAQPSPTSVDMRDLTLLAEHEFANGWSLHSLTSWDKLNFRSTIGDMAQLQAPLLQFHDSQYGESWQQELRLESLQGQTLEWMTGVFLYDNEFRRGDRGNSPSFSAGRFSDHPAVSALTQRVLNFPVPLPLAASGQLGFLDAWQETDYAAVFAQATWNVSEQFRLTAGARWQTEGKDAGVLQWTNSPTPSVLTRVLAPMGVSGGGLARDTQNATWSLTSQWRLRDDVMLFATAATGFKSGGFNTAFGRVPLEQREFGDEEVMHYEAGIKLESARRRWRLAANVFNTRYDNYQEAAFVGGQFNVSNAEEVTVDGFEVEGTIRVADNITADFAVSLADLVYGRNFNAPCYFGRRPDSPLNNGACDLSGKHPVNAPEWKTHAGLQYEASQSWGRLNLRADWSWTDDYNTNANNDPRLTQQAYHWLSVRAGLTRGAYELVLWGDNVNDVTVVNYDAVLTLYPGDASYQSMLQQPRSFGVTLRVDY